LLEESLRTDGFQNFKKFNVVLFHSELLAYFYERTYKFETPSGKFDPENAYRKPPITLKINQKAAYDTYILADFSPSNEG
jgi:hypothetical protein